MSDIDVEGLAETEAQVAKARPNTKVTTAKLDVADRDAIYAWAEQVVEDHGKVNLIFNNAGVALGASIEQMKIADFEWLMGINFWGVVNGTQAFLPHLKASGDGHVINISSVFGLVPIPTQSAYNAAKFGVRGFTEALRIELDIADNGVSATCVHPGGIKTNIARNARMHVDEGDTTSDLEKAKRRPREGVHHHAHEGRGADPQGGRGRQASGAHRPRRPRVQPARPPARSGHPTHHRRRRQAAPLRQRVGPGAETDPDPPALTSDRDQPAEPPATS